MNMSIFTRLRRNTPCRGQTLPPNEEAEYLRRLKEFRECRREAGIKIDPETAEVLCSYGDTSDPYEIDPLLPEEWRQGGRNYFARSPGSDIWVYFGDLPAATADALGNKEPINGELPF